MVASASTSRAGPRGLHAATTKDSSTDDAEELRQQFARSIDLNNQVRAQHQKRSPPPTDTRFATDIRRQTSSNSNSASGTEQPYRRERSKQVSPGPSSRGCSAQGVRSARGATNVTTQGAGSSGEYVSCTSSGANSLAGMSSTMPSHAGGSHSGSYKIQSCASYANVKEMADKLAVREKVF